MTAITAQFRATAMTQLQTASDNTFRSLSDDEIALVSGGGITIEADRDYFGIEISFGGYVCGEVKTPGEPPAIDLNRLQIKRMP